MSKPLVTILGKTVKKIAGLRGGGSALPGLIVEHIDPEFVRHTLSDLPMGVVVVSGTNGKTTTTKMVVELLESQGMKVFTNRTGSNFSRGVVAALLGDINLQGKLDADIAVLELDEAHAVSFVSKVTPRFSLILNVMRDQLDRFGEVDYTAKLLTKIAEATTDKTILNREDPRIANIAKSLDKSKTDFFGLNSTLLSMFPSDDNLHGQVKNSDPVIPARVTLESVRDGSASFCINDKVVSTKIKLSGVYNIYNAAAAITLTYAIMNNKVDEAKLLRSLANIEPAFGRGEVLTVDDQPLEIVLVKNPSGFRLGLVSFNPDNYVTMIAINDNYADGRDMSWLWDVDFTSLQKDGVKQVSGIRAYDMALRLQYDEVKIESVDTDLTVAVKRFIKSSKNQPKRIYCTYTAMTSIRRILSKVAKVEVVK
ncbi:DUF1727 domain-containing protein [Candidatus Saccharibacteria bacterium]|nr:DUF1727 domain-containing protein [Candidatus Saccharibacteria bacterium]